MTEETENAQGEQPKNKDSKSTTTDQQRQRPAAKFESTGNVSVAVWRNVNNDGGANFTVSIEKSYRKPDGSYQKKSALDDNDLLKVSRLLQLADDWIEREKGRTRSDQNFTDRVR